LESFVGDESNKFLRSNVVHLLALTADSIIGLRGGLKHLLAKSTSPGDEESPKVIKLFNCKGLDSDEFNGCIWHCIIVTTVYLAETVATTFIVFFTQLS